MRYDGANITMLKAALSAHGLSPNKRLGQNFLRDANIADAIVRAAGELSSRRVLEIGPGAGALTTRLLAQNAHVTAIELDAGLCRLLSANVDSPRFRLIHGDALKVSIDDMALGEDAVLVANLPYYVTTPLLMRALTEMKAVRRMVLMMQKEVAQRLCAPPGGRDYGSLSVAVAYYAATKVAMNVSPSCFYPAPEVASSVVVLERREPPADVDEGLLFDLVRACFAMRRKTLMNNLTAFAPLGREGAAAALSASGLDGGARAEQLPLDSFIKLANAASAYLESRAGA